MLITNGNIYFILEGRTLEKGLILTDWQGSFSVFILHKRPNNILREDVLIKTRTWFITSSPLRISSLKYNHIKNCYIFDWEHSIHHRFNSYPTWIIEASNPVCHDVVTGSHIYILIDVQDSFDHQLCEYLQLGYISGFNA